MAAPVRPDPLDAARVALAAVTTVVPHTDADGLAAGALALRARGWGVDRAVLLGRGRTPWDDDAPLPAGSPAVLDWGVRALPRPALIVDHHAPETAADPGQVVISGYGAIPELTTSILTARLVGDAPAWLVAIGAHGDLGDVAFTRPECAGAPRGIVRRLVPLVNAPRRLPHGPVATALALLVEHDDPRDVLRDPRLGGLEEARREWRSAYDAAVRVAPRVRGDVAVIRLSSPYQIHPIVAAAWQRRLAPALVLVANDGYLPGRVNFAVRGGTGDLRRRLRLALPDVGGEFAHGHDRATGGSLAPDDFERLLDGLETRQ